MEIEEVVVHDRSPEFFDCREFVVDFPNMEMIEQATEECKEDVDITVHKMHRYPASIRALGIDERYTTRMVVAIGPYHPRKKLQEAEKMKLVAANQCIKDSAHSTTMEDMYEAVVPVARDVRRLYDKDVMAGITEDDFARMMFFGACFLVQYMLLRSDYTRAVKTMEKSLSSFFDSNKCEIVQDIMLLENQIPWCVVKTVMEFRPVDLRALIYYYTGNSLRKEKPFLIEPPHLLGLLWFYIVGTRRTPPEQFEVKDSIYFSFSANELHKMGITLKATKSSELIHMGFRAKGPSLGELLLAPVTLDDAQVSWLVNMAALELCTTSNFQYQYVEDEESAVCSYLLLLATLVTREEDVQKLRTQHILEGAGLANREVLKLLTKFHGLRLGTTFVRTLVKISHYRRQRRIRTKLYALYYGNKPTIAKIASVIVGTAGIIGTIIGVIKNLKTIDKP